jgi:hypothetical protein
LHGTMPGTVAATSPVSVEAQFVAMKLNARGPTMGPGPGLRLGPAVPRALRTSCGVRHAARRGCVNVSSHATKRRQASRLKLQSRPNTT